VEDAVRVHRHQVVAAATTLKLHLRHSEILLEKVRQFEIDRNKKQKA